MFGKVLIANRGEIAVRVIRTCRDLGIATVAVYSDADAGAMHVRLADEAYHVPGTSARETYLNVDALVAAVDESAADAVHPGYGFLSESTLLAAALQDRRVSFIGPGVNAIEVMGSKVSARVAAAAAGVPVVPGLAAGVESAEEIVAFGDQHGYPIAIKAAYGGGGRGLRVVRSREEVAAALDSARREAGAAFGRTDVYPELYLDHPKHIEMQILVDSFGDGIWLGERECSVQRRHQKLIEESPAIALTSELREQMGAAAVAIACSIGYVNAGTVEFLVQDGRFYFLEMNTRLQVEHPVTELVTGLDLVAEQLRIADGQPLRMSQVDVASRGHAIEVRVNAEDPAGGAFIPTPGRLTALQFPAGVGIRVDDGYTVGDVVSEFYDGLLAKIVCWADDRPAAIARMRRALAEVVVEGIRTTVPAQQLVLDHPEFVSDSHDTRWLDERVTIPDSDSPPRTDDEGTDIGAVIDRSIVEIADRRYWIPNLGARAAADSGPTNTARRAPMTRTGGTSGTARTRGDDASDGRIVSPMQGTILAIEVAVGDAVEPGQSLAVLEAMKMESPILAAAAGVIEQIGVATGDSVSAGQLLMVVVA